VRVHAAGKTAISRFTPLQGFRSLATLMDVAIDTGRSHQIRVHAAFAGHPVAGDEKYGDREFNRRMRDLGLRRMFLHAAAVSFTWPDTKQPFEITVELPNDLADLLARLRAATSASVQG
jgi:23S rRNA pseudouridine955/2504/2580 synthase